MKTKIDLKLPEWAWLFGHEGNNILQDRDVLLHVRSASVIEFVLEENVGKLNIKNFKYFDMPECLGGDRMIALPYYMNADEFDYDEEIIDKAIAYFIEWSRYEDEKAIDEFNTDFLSMNN